MRITLAARDVGVVDEDLHFAKTGVIIRLHDPLYLALSATSSLQCSPSPPALIRLNLSSFPDHAIQRYFRPQPASTGRICTSPRDADVNPAFRSGHESLVR